MLTRLISGLWGGRRAGSFAGRVDLNHVRQQVREAFAATVTGLTTTGARVFQSRIYNLADTDLPGLRIYTEHEAIVNEDILSTPYMQHRTITLRCEALAKTNTTLDDLLDTICEEVETAIAADPTLGGLSPLHASVRRSDQDMDGNTDQTAGMATMDWQFVVLTMSDAPNVAL